MPIKNLDPTQSGERNVGELMKMLTQAVRREIGAVVRIILRKQYMGLKQPVALTTFFA